MEFEVLADGVRVARPLLAMRCPVPTYEEFLQAFFRT